MTLPCKTGVDPLLRVGWTIWKGAFVMTIREWAMDYCLQRGMPPTSAKAVLERWVNLETNNEEMGCPWEWDTTDELFGISARRAVDLHRLCRRGLD